jgi:hypothetical protein
VARHDGGRPLPRGALIVSWPLPGEITRGLPVVARQLMELVVLTRVPADTLQLYYQLWLREAPAPDECRPARARGTRRPRRARWPCPDARPAAGRRGAGLLALVLVATPPWHGIAFARFGDSPVYETLRREAARVLYLPVWPGDSASSGLYLYAVTRTRVPMVKGYSPLGPRRYVDDVFESLQAMKADPAASGGRAARADPIESLRGELVGGPARLFPAGRYQLAVRLRAAGVGRGPLVRLSVSEPAGRSLAARVTRRRCRPGSTGR